MVQVNLHRGVEHQREDDGEDEQPMAARQLVGEDAQAAAGLDRRRHVVIRHKEPEEAVLVEDVRKYGNLARPGRWSDSRPLRRGQLGRLGVVRCG